MSLKDSTVRGVEALVRWRHPERGLLPPVAFVPLAEETDLILDLGAWVANAAAMQAGRWLHAGIDLGVSFNLSPRQLVDQDATAALHAVLDAGHCDPAKLTVEVTESTAVLDLQTSTRTLETLRGRGISIALDDFGVGESSLSRLADLPVDILKIDRSFVSGLPDDRPARALTESAIGLAHGLDLRPHAEGVETPEQARWLRDAGCVDAQGFGFGRPMPAADITAMVTSSRKAVVTG